MVLDHSSCSRDHAVLQWAGDAWELRDLGSTNGTFVDGRRLPGGSTARLGPDALLGFGSGPGARLVDEGEPQPLARSDEGQLIEGRFGTLDLPLSGEEVLAVWPTAQGAWRLESGNEVRPVTDGDQLEAGGQRWVLMLPEHHGASRTEAEESATERARAAIPLEIGDFDVDDRSLRTEEGPVLLSPIETRLLSYLAERPREVIPYRELLSRVWGYRESVESRTVYVTVARLRQKIEREPASPRHLQAVPGQGYRFVPLA